MIEVEIEGKRKLCFLIRKGEKNYIVIPIDGMLSIDYKRISDMESQGGDLMRVMRDTTLDNGKNALSLYQDTFKVVPIKKPQPAKQQIQETVSQESAQSMDANADEQKPKRGRGRPKGSKTKKQS